MFVNDLRVYVPGATVAQWEQPLGDLLPLHQLHQLHPLHPLLHDVKMPLLIEIVALRRHSGDGTRGRTT